MSNHRIIANWQKNKIKKRALQLRYTTLGHTSQHARESRGLEKCVTGTAAPAPYSLRLKSRRKTPG